MDIILDLYDRPMAEAFVNGLKKPAILMANMRFGEEGSMFTLINLIPNNHIRVIL